METKSAQVIVLTCDKYLESRCQAIKKTWGSVLNTVYLTDSTIGGEFLGYNTPKTYEGIQDKYYQFFLNFDFTEKYYFFVDDDTFINIKMLEALELPQQDKFCIGRETVVNPDQTDKYGQNTGYPLHLLRGVGCHLPIVYPSGGSGFIVSRRACLDIQSFLRGAGDSKPLSGHSDVTFGFWMRASGCPFFHSSLFWWDTRENLIGNRYDHFDVDSDFVTLHYVNESLMVDYHSRFNS